ncbi:acetolactate synthase catalytic subunit [Microbacterium sp. NFH-22A-Y]|uniref:acetolactate synthase catalytic subunit n=1 Tax=Microbacterium sp. NFH-22A-Y TaxID=2744448 RepID=UPI001F2512A6|nr:acetolactate synthase catalytic subunit [Microbacterium sp. NFH-22A-Y]
MTTVAQALAEAFLRNGVKEAFGQSLPSAFFLAAQEAGIRQISYRTENAGGAMADGYARISHQVTLVGAQNGPAATLLVPPLSEAMKVSIPIIAVVQEVPAFAKDKNAFQELDHVALFQSCSKWTRTLVDPARVDEYVDAAVRAATTGRPGPVVLLVPKDVLGADVPGTVRHRVARLGTFPADRPRPSAEAIAEAAHLIAGAEQPLLVAGGGVHVSDAADVLARLQAAASIAVATTNMGKGSVDEHNPLSVGVIGNAMGTNGATKFQRDFVRDSDVIVFVGTRTNENGTDSWSLFPDDASYIHIDIDPVEISRNYESMRLVGDAREALQDLLDALELSDLAKRKNAEAAVVSAIAQGKAAHFAEVDDLTHSEAVPIRPERVLSELERLLRPDDIIVADASYSTIWLQNYLTSRRPGQRFITPRGLAGLGWGFPMALGAKAASPTSRVVCISGDGGFGHVWGELETSIRERLPITLIVLNNSILGFQKHSELFQFGRHTSAIDFAPVDHSAIATAVGARSYRIEDPADIAEALEDSLDSEVLTLIEIVTDPNAHPPIRAWEQPKTASMAGAE